MQDLSNMKSPTFIISLELGLVITCLLSFSCHKKKAAYNEFWEEYRRSNQYAWEDKDTTTLVKWINLLKDTSFSDYQFYDVIIAIQDKTNFGYMVSMTRTARSIGKRRRKFAPYINKILL